MSTFENRVKDLIGLKLALLFHDPPNKMWVSAHFISHEQVAQEFAEKALGETLLKKLYDQATTNFKNLVELADSTAASFDRWLLKGFKKQSEYYVHYENLHNIFNPSLQVKLYVEGMKDPVKEWSIAAINVNLILRFVEEYLKNLPEHEKAVLLYNILYSILEPVWYVSGFFPSLADTRTPTHTVFDHLYASASLANIVGNTGFSGYYVVLDYPGIQKFVSAGRKAGDFWASSWVLSNIMWRTALEYARKYGFDVVLTPTPRLNPYTFRSLLAMIAGRGGVEGFYGITCSGIPKVQPELKKLLEESVCKMLANLYGIDQVEPGDWRELDVLLHQPLIPATISMLLPSIVAESPEKLANDILENFKRSWQELYNFMENSLKNMASRPHEGSFVARILLENLQNAKSVLELPPHGLRVFVIRVESVYRDLKACIVEEKLESCRKIGLMPNLSVLHEIAGREPDTQKRLLEELTRRILYYVLVTRWPMLVKHPEYGYYVVPIPRPFSHYDTGEEQIKQVVEHETTCSLCGDEPAVLKLGKKFDSRGVLTYDDETVKTIQATLKNYSVTADQLVELSKVLKPGEALGPYCLLKRAVYQVFREKLGILSTDDVALLRVSRIARYRRRAFNAILERVQKTCENGDKLVPVLKHLYEYEYREFRTSIKDIESSANALDYSFDRFVEVANECITRACIDSLLNASHELLEIAVEAYNFERGVPSQLQTIKAKLPRSVIEGLCKVITIPTSYAIVRGDADNIGKLLRGVPLGYPNPKSYLQCYSNLLLKAIAEQGEIRVPSGVSKESVLQELKQSYERYASIIDALGLDSVLVSPSWHFAVSLSLVLSAIEDYKVSRELDGLLVYTGGDDVLAFYPVQTAMSATREHRERFTGDGFKRVCKKTPVTSSLVTGRSFSVRFVNLKDNMSEEANLAFELLEELAKNARWALLSGEKKWEKDSLVVSDSRAGVEAVLPQRVKTPCEVPLEESIYMYIDNLLVALVLNAISKNLPEDMDSFIEGHGVDIEKGLGEIVAYILRRNVKRSGEPVHDDFIATNILPTLRKTVHEVSGSIGKEKTNLALEFYSKLFRILRRHVG